MPDIPVRPFQQHVALLHSIAALPSQLHKIDRQNIVVIAATDQQATPGSLQSTEKKS